MKIGKTAESTWRPVAKRQQEKTHMDGKCNPFRSGPIRSVSGGDEKRRRENLTERDINNINNIYNNTTR
ncbi:MAG: hypothetical protein ILO34_05770, partial [Kiritimatiellae bacterium]|nr:hypothetical protein [Kiritimatiellia bacterium]